MRVYDPGGSLLIGFSTPSGQSVAYSSGTAGTVVVSPTSGTGGGSFQGAGLVAGLTNLVLSGETRTLSGTIVSSGTFAALGGTILVYGTVNGGVFQALSGGTVTIGSGTIRDGTVKANSGGTIDLGGQGILRDVLLTGHGVFESTGEGNYDDGSELQDVTLAAGVSLTALAIPVYGGLMALGGTIANGGTISPSAALGIDGPVTLTGGGTLAFDGGYAVGGQTLKYHDFLLHLNTAPDALDNINNMITGNGSISIDLTNEAGGVIEAGSGQQLSVATIMNKGLIEAHDGGALSIITLYGTAQNTGTIEAITGATVDVNASMDNAGGLIESLSGGTVTIDSNRNGAVIRGGTVEADSTSTVIVGPAGILRDVLLTGHGVFESTGEWYYNQGSELQDVTLAAGVSLTALEIPVYGGLMALGGTIANGGTISPSAALGIDGPVTLTGGGTLAFDGGYAVGGQTLKYHDFLLHLNTAPDALDNINNMITGNGSISVDLTNEAGGVIEAGSGQQLSVATIMNKGLIEAHDGGALSISGSALDNTGGTIQAHQQQVGSPSTGN